MIGTKQQITEYLSNKDDTLIFEITQKQVKNIRSYAQNKYYFGVILEYICKFIGLEHKFEKMEMHKDIKDYFNLETTTDLSTSEFKAMCNEIRAWYLENRELYIPLPSQVEDLANLETYLF